MSGTVSEPGKKQSCHITFQWACFCYNDKQECEDAVIQWAEMRKGFPKVKEMILVKSEIKTYITFKIYVNIFPKSVFFY